MPEFGNLVIISSFESLVINDEERVRKDIGRKLWETDEARHAVRRIQAVAWPGVMRNLDVSAPPFFIRSRAANPMYWHPLGRRLYMNIER